MNCKTQVPHCCEKNNFCRAKLIVITVICSNALACLILSRGLLTVLSVLCLRWDSNTLGGKESANWFHISWLQPSTDTSSSSIWASSRRAARSQTISIPMLEPAPVHAQLVTAHRMTTVCFSILILLHCTESSPGATRHSLETHMLLNHGDNKTLYGQLLRAEISRGLRTP